MPLDADQITSAIAFNDAHADDLLPGLGRRLERRETDFVPEMIELIASLQRKHGLGADGKIGGDTRKAIVDELPLYDAAPLLPATGQDARTHWLALARELGVPQPLARGLLIGLRGLRLGAAQTHAQANRPAYDDTFVWLPVTGEIETFPGATHPYQERIRGSLGEDVDGDGRKDVATLKPGFYSVMHTTKHRGSKAMHVHTRDDDDRVPVWRDIDHDRGIGLRERARNDLSGGQILFHPGFDTPHGNGDGDRFASIGCQTASGATIDMLHARVPFDYLLVDVNERLAKTP